jgi:class 3 adenylate cyclase
MAPVQHKSLRNPDERYDYPLGSTDEVHLGELVVGRSRAEPGWRWSTHVKPIIGTKSCQAHHIGLALSGAMRVRLDDGSEFEIVADDVFDIPPGHDAWVVGDEPAVSLEWVGVHRWAVPRTDERILATILITDIVDSTRLAERLGDASWRQLLDEHNVRLRQALDRFRGREVATTGDGILAIFDGAERAVRAADAARVALRDLELAIRAGIHTGEVELVPGNVRGVAVHIAARLLALADPGEVLVSGTTRDLIEARDLSFADRGTHELKGVSGARAVFALPRRSRCGADHRSRG